MAAAALALAACGSSGSRSSAPAPKSTPTRTQPAVAPARFVLGHWHGQLHQRGMPPFRITVTVASLSNRAPNPVHYSGLDCGGHWTYLGARGVTVHFREVIDSGRSSKCKGAGQIILIREGSRLRYRFGGGGVVSRGVLSRG